MKKLFLVLLFFLCAGIVPAVEVPEEEDPFWNSFRKSRPERIKWWRKARFGIFIHWNTSSILELTSGSWNRDRTKNNRGVIKGIDLNKPLPEAITDGSYTNYMGQAGVPLEIYDNLFRISFRSPRKAGRQTDIIAVSPKIEELELKNEVLSSDVSSP